MKNIGKILVGVVVIAVIAAVSYLRSDKHRAALAQERDRQVLLADAVKVRDAGAEAARVMENATRSWGHWCRGVESNIAESRPGNEQEMRDALKKLEEAYRFINDGSRVKVKSDLKQQSDSAIAYCEILEPIQECQDAIKAALAYCGKAGPNAPSGIEVQDHVRDTTEIILWRSSAQLWESLERFKPYMEKLKASDKA